MEQIISAYLHLGGATTHFSMIRTFNRLSLQLCLALAAQLLLTSCAPKAVQPAKDAVSAVTPPSAAAKEGALLAQSQGESREHAGGSVLARLKEHGKLRVGMTGELPPFNMTTIDGQLIGLEVDLMNMLARSLDVELVIVEKQFSELLPAVEAGEIDLAISSITMTPKRNLNVEFVGPYFVSGMALLTKSETLAAAEGGKDLNAAGVRLGAIAGSTSEAFLKQAAPKASLVPVPSYSEGVQAVVERRIDGLVAELPMVAVTLLRNPDAGFAAVGEPMSFEPIGIALPPGNAHFVNLVRNYMTLMEGTGTLEALRARWFGQSDWVNALPPAAFGQVPESGAPFRFRSQSGI